MSNEGRSHSALGARAKECNRPKLVQDYHREAEARLDAIDEAEAAFGNEIEPGAPLSTIFPSGITVTMLDDEVTGIEESPQGGRT